MGAGDFAGGIAAVNLGWVFIVGCGGFARRFAYPRERASRAGFHLLVRYTSGQCLDANLYNGAPERASPLLMY